MSSKRARPMRKPVSRTPAWVMPAAIVAGLAVLLAAFLVIRWYMTPIPPPPPSHDTTIQVIATITSLPASEFDTIGQGTANNLIKPISGTPLTGSSGKPVVFYYGAEFCPYCAAERWPLIIALTRFGSFTGLQTSTSSSSDVYPNTPTFTFRSATYSSTYIEFQAVETADRDKNPLQTPTAAEQQLISRYDASGTIPFVDFGNRYAFNGATYSPDLIGGMSWLAVADSLKQPESTQAKAIIGSANLITAAVCKMTSDKSTTVCGSTTIQDLEKKLG